MADPALPLVLGAARLEAGAPERMVGIVPFARQEAAVAAALGTAGPVGLPTDLPVGARVALAGGGWLTWAGARFWLLAGAPAATAAVALAGIAAVAEQGDAWAAMRLSGADRRDVLARLVPLDLAPADFPPGASARTLLGHVPLLLVATEADFELLVPRSYADSALDDLARAMRAVAGRRTLGMP